MIIVSHNFLQVESITHDGSPIPFDSKNTIGKIIYVLAQEYKEQIIIWCHKKVTEKIDTTYIETALVGNRLFFSYTPFANFLPRAIGYIEDSPFINVNKEVVYPTWQMSSYVGVIKATTILLTPLKLWDNSNFDLSLIHIGKNYQSKGLFCYSNPKLIVEKVIVEERTAALSILFAFVKQHYKITWTLLLFLNLFLYEKKVPLFSFLKGVLFSKKKILNTVFKTDEITAINNFSEETIDVIIPTIGRKKHLYDVLTDLKRQSVLPQNVIIVEQNPLSESASELDYIENEDWPFQIKHIFTHQTGACQARNKALEEVTSKWVFLNDDDNRFDVSLIENAIRYLKGLHVNCLITAYPQPKEIIHNNCIAQTTIFGSGNAFLKSEIIQQIHFDLALEFGYGEDTEFGLQLRNIGEDVIYVPNLVITHLKAPMGGFRTKFIHPWETEIIQPKPSPTVLYFRKKYYSEAQIKGYKTILFLKFYKSQEIKNPFRYFRTMQKRWKASEKWTTILLNKNAI
ncbi:glycosyltransferase family 2 protein [Flavobacterium sp. J27]|uniref:glycosyltransferase family 2 protein n=1 Tax=Flavobacterium sp. J27 TaxID=2060419 RepID=UPI001030CD3A|nr:glycosyltransferase family A protein [Flavobacterium sp. J27]